MAEGYLLGQGPSYGLTQQQVVNITQPAAGGGFTQAFGGWDRFRLVFCRFRLTTDANVANRFVAVQYLQDGSNILHEDSSAQVIAASQTNQVFCGKLGFGSSEFVATGNVNFSLCGIWLEAGATIKLNIGAVQVGDQLTQITVVFDRFLKPSQMMGGTLADDIYVPATTGYAEN